MSSRLTVRGSGAALTGKSVRLRQVLRGDRAAYQRWINDRGLVQRSAPFRPISDFSHDEWFDSVNKRVDAVIFSIVAKASKKLVGSCSLRNIQSVNRSAELQIRIGESFGRGRGLGTEAIELLLRHGFEDLNLHRIYLHVFGTNTAAIRVYEKCGFRNECVQREAVYVDDRYVDVHMMAILRPEYRSRSALVQSEATKARSGGSHR